ncbi:MAG TPA: aminotransferase class III-fold pyridoxal phosphate-dependent enzyme [Actinomycetota bacterium]|nr:aminotransferase class III-fold pyridoxal phosphate-dependent enzyme [Actinomycetota bacterium]
MDGPSVTPPLPGPRSRALLERMDALLYPGLAHGLGPFVIRRKEGSFIEDVDGNVFLDLISGMASVPLGAANERIMRAATEAHVAIGMEDAHFYAHEHMLPLAEQLIDIAPPGIARVDIALNGTEAVETMIRFMRRATGRPIVIGFMGGYHGEAGTAGAVGAETGDLSAGYRALMPGFVHVPYPNPYRTPFTTRPGGSGDGTVDFIRDHLLFHAIDPSEVAGVVIEPVLGSGGCVAPPDAFWTGLGALCEEFGFLLGVDEVKCGFGRAGTMFAVERWDVRPDLMALGKAMGGGVMPIGAVLGTERAMGFDDLSTGSTWSWFPASCAAALETLAVFREEPVLENVRALETVGRAALEDLAARDDGVGDVRAVGCFQAIELVRDRASKERDADRQERLALGMAERGILADASTTSLNIQPSLVLEPDRLRGAYDVIGDVLAATRGG